MFPDNCKSPLIGRFNYLHPRPLARHSDAQLHCKSNYFPASSSSAAFYALHMFPRSSLPSLIKSRQTGSRYWEYLQMPQTRRWQGASFCLICRQQAFHSLCCWPSPPRRYQLFPNCMLLSLFLFHRLQCWPSLWIPVRAWKRLKDSSPGADVEKHDIKRTFFFGHVLQNGLKWCPRYVKPLHDGVCIKALLLVSSQATRLVAKVVNLASSWSIMNIKSCS